VQVDVLPAPSVAVTVTVVLPTGKVEPETWLYASVTEQASLAVAAKVAVPLAAPGSSVPYTRPGQLIEGGVTSLLLTVTVNEHVAVRPEASVAVAVTVDEPAVNVLPEAGLYVTVAEQLSVAVAA
jgi:hypothetical protein